MYGMVWYGMVKVGTFYGMVWYGMVWRLTKMELSKNSTVWYGMVWCEKQMCRLFFCLGVWYGMVLKGTRYHTHFRCCPGCGVNIKTFSVFVWCGIVLYCIVLYSIV